MSGPNRIRLHSIIRTMRLSDFILANTENILKEWEIFGRSLEPGERLERQELRDHAVEILYSAAKDMKSPQTRLEQRDKSKGEGRHGHESTQVDAASVRHGADRVSSGFNINDLIAEYRALRASVLKLWREGEPTPITDFHHFNDVDRFNECIDQSLAGAVRSYTQRVDRSRLMFLAMLGHDLRNPLQALRSGATLLTSLEQVGAEGKSIASQIKTTAVAMDKLISNLLNFTSSSLGRTPPLTLARTDLHTLCADLVKEMRIAHPSNTFCFDLGTEIWGEWDGSRLRQMISNLLSNAVQHGARETAVKLQVKETTDGIEIAVRNEGAPIPAEEWSTIFDPLMRGANAKTKLGQDGSIGLGLFIAHEVAVSHGGKITVMSSHDDGTAFTVHLPKREESI